MCGKLSHLDTSPSEDDHRHLYLFETFGSDPYLPANSSIDGDRKDGPTCVKVAGRDPR